MTERKVAIIFGASRGIGRQISISLSRAGYTVVLCSKSVGGASSSSLSLGSNNPPNPNSRESTIDTVLREIVAAGGHGLAVPCDVRKEKDVAHVVAATMARYSRIDAIIYNPGAVWWSAIETTPVKRYDLMHEINARGMYVAVCAVLPVFHAQSRGRFILVSPPIYSRFIRGKTAYAMTKFSASVMTMGLGMDIERRAGYGAGDDIAITTIDSAATQGPSIDKTQLRRPDIFGDAVLEILRAPVDKVNGKLLVDEDFLRQECAYTDAQIAQYALMRGTQPRRIMPAAFPDLTVAEQDDQGDRRDSASMPRHKI